MTERATVFENVQLGKEHPAARGLAVPADRILQALMLTFSADLTSQRIRPSGNKLDTRVAPRRRSGTGALDASGAAFEEVCFPLESIFGIVAPTIPGGATNARERLYGMETRGPDTYRSYTLQKGSAAGAARMTHAVFTGMTMEFSSEELTIAGTIMGRLPERGIAMTAAPNVAEVWTLSSTATGGTLAVTVDTDGNPQTASGLAFNISAAALQTALEALSNVAPGDVAAAGGPLGTAPITLTFPLTGVLDGIPLRITVNGAGLTGGSASVVETTPGVVMTTVPLTVMDPLQALITVDDTYGAIGTTVMERTISARFGVTDKYAPLWVVNRLNNGTWPTLIERPVDATLGLVMAADSDSNAFLSRFEAGDVAYVRIDVLGEEIESGQDYQFRADFAASVENLSEGDQDDVWADTWGLRMVDDANIPGVSILVRNGVALL